MRLLHRFQNNTHGYSPVQKCIVPALSLAQTVANVSFLHLQSCHLRPKMTTSEVVILLFCLLPLPWNLESLQISEKTCFHIISELTSLQLRQNVRLLARAPWESLSQGTLQAKSLGYHWEPCVLWQKWAVFSELVEISWNKIFKSQIRSCWLWGIFSRRSTLRIIHFFPPHNTSHDVAHVQKYSGCCCTNPMLRMCHKDSFRQNDKS